MASYKVPQDVEADDKLIGPFSFRQFIYLIIVAAAIGIAYFLSKLFIGLIILPLPIILFFGALALPLRKDQPMETYLAAIVSFYLKPHKRLWNPDGAQTLVQITAPKVVEVQRTKNLSEDEAERRLSYLASIVDSRGWAVRGVEGQQPIASTAMNPDVFYEAQQAVDVLDESTGIGRNLDTRLEQASSKRHHDMLARVQKQASEPRTAVAAQPAIDATAPVNQPQQQQPNPTVAPLQPAAASQQQPAPQQPVTDDDNTVHLTMNPYPTSMHQTVVAPVSQQPAPQPVAAPPETTSEKQPSPDIMNLANNSDLSVETIAREAHRIQAKAASEDEVVISLR